MGPCCGIAAGVAKYLLFIANALAMMAAVIIMVIGVRMLQNLNIFSELFERAFFSTPIAVISIGATICLISFFGSFGALIESRCMLLTYCSLLILALLAEVAVGSYALLQYNTIDDFMSIRVQEFFTAEYANDTSSTCFDNIQERLHCCGANGPEDFLPMFPEGSNQVPPSCCQASMMLCSINTAYPVGCITEMTRFVRDLFTLIGIVTCSLAGVKILGLAVATCLASHYKKPTCQHPPHVVSAVSTHQHPPPITDLSTYQIHQPTVEYQHLGVMPSNQDGANRTSQSKEMPRF